MSNEAESDEEKDFSELLDEYQDQEKMFHFEGDSGVEKLSKLCNAIGYQEHQFRFGSPLEVFLADNPGACAALVEWIAEQGNQQPEWKEELLSNLNEADNEDEDAELE